MSTAGGTQQGNNPLADAPEGIKPPKQTSSSDASPDSVKKLGEPGQYKNSAGLAAVAEVASVAGDDVGDSEETKLDEQTASNAESTTEI